MAVKRGHIDLDPDYEDVSEQQTKRQRVLEEDAKEATRHKIENIIRQQFTMEIQNKEEEVDEVDQRLNQSRLVMDRLRACIIANYYSKAGQQKFSKIKQNPNEPPCIHPTVKEHIGKAPINYSSSMETSDEGDNFLPVDMNIVKKEPVENPGSNVCISKADKIEKMPILETVSTKIDQEEGRSSRFKMKKRIVVGNLSKYIPVDRREENDQSTHKWMIYVRGSKEEPRIDHYIKKVWFFLHPSYRPNDLVEVSQPPFHLTRRGWGEFPVRVQLHFKDQRNKRLDIIHQLKLDRTYTGLQTLGSETNVDIELEKEKLEEKAQSVTMPTTFDLKSQLKSNLKKSKPESEQNITITEHLTPKKKAKVTPIVNGVNSAEDLTSIVFQDPSKNIVKSLQKGDQVNKCSGILQNPSNHLSILKRTTNSPSVCPSGQVKPSAKPQSVQILLGGFGSVSNPYFTNEKGDNRTEKNSSKGHQSLCNGKGDNLVKVSHNKETNSAKEQKSAVILQGIGSLTTKMTPSQSQMRLVTGVTPETNLLINMCSSASNIDAVGSIQTSKNSIVTVKSTSVHTTKSSGIPTLPVSKPNTGTLVGQLTQQLIGNNTLIVQPNLQTSKMNNMIVRPTTESNMLFIQSVPQTTRPRASLVQQTLQNTKPNTVIINPSVPTSKASTTVVQPAVKTSIGSPSTPISKISGTGSKTGTIIVQPSQSSSATILQTQQSSAITPQTLYYRCKDAQGNIFLVPQQLLKQVIQPSTKSAAQISSSSSNTGTATSVVSSTKVPVTSPLILGANSAVKPGLQQPLVSTGVNTSQSTIISAKGITSTNQNSPIILSVNSSGQMASSQISTNQNKSLLKSAITSLSGQDVNLSAGNTSLNLTLSSHEQVSKSPAKILNSVSPISSNTCASKQQTLIIPSSAASILAPSPQKLTRDDVNKLKITQTVSKPVVVSTVTTTCTSQTMSTTQKAGNSLLLTTNNSNGKTIVMPTHNLNSNNLSATSGTSLLLQTNQKVPTSKSDHVIIQKQNSKLHGLDNNSIRIVLEDKSNLPAQVSSNKNLNIVQQSVTMTTTTASSTMKCVASSVLSLQSSSGSVQGQISNKNLNIVQQSVAMSTTTASSTMKCVTNSGLSLQSSSVSGQGQMSSQGQLQVTPQGLKIVVNASLKNSQNTSNNINLTSKPGSSSFVNDTSKISVDESVITIDSAEKLRKGNGISILPKEFQKPMISSSNPSSLLATKNVTSKTLAPSPSLLLNTTPSLTLTSSGSEGQSSSLLPSRSKSILGRIGDKKIVIDLSSKLDTTSKHSSETGEKRIICLRKKSEYRRPLSPPGSVEEIKPIYRPEDYPDVLSLVRAAVKRHPVVSMEADKYQHPYCASTIEEWLSWKVGKRRASEWQRAMFCRKFIKNCIKGETYRGTKLWTTKQIMLWCRLHAFSPHYLESTLHPFGVELTADRIGIKFSSVTDSGEVITEATEMLRGAATEIGEEEDIDIINTEQIIPMKKVKENIEMELNDVDVVQPSESALYIQDTCQKIGIKFQPSEIVPGVCSSTCEDMIFSAMKCFIGDVVTETFASKVCNGRYPDSISMTDVFQALKSTSQADFLTNSHLGVKVTDSSTLHR